MKLRGWNKLHTAVYDHASGVRCHTMGLARLRSGVLVNGNQWPTSRRRDHWVRIYGNRRRGTLAWAAEQQEIDDDLEYLSCPTDAFDDALH